MAVLTTHVYMESFKMGSLHNPAPLNLSHRLCLTTRLLPDLTHMNAPVLMQQASQPLNFLDVLTPPSHTQFFHVGSTLCALPA